MAEITRPLGSLILQTIETRWFGRGAAPSDIVAWFEALPGEVEDQPVRRDFYLQSLHDDGLSVKLREGGLEVKQRQAALGLIHFSRSVTGLVERWTKWRFRLDQSSSPLQAIFARDRSWIPVDKERCLKHYQLNETGTTQIAPSPANLASGNAGAGGGTEGSPLTFHLELARVWAGESYWWTLGYEADSGAEMPPDRLLEAAGSQFKEGVPGQLTGPNSFSYPHWLAKYLE